MKLTCMVVSGLNVLCIVLAGLSESEPTVNLAQDTARKQRRKAGEIPEMRGTRARLSA
ncbi:hypothetical protein BURKHO8Y_520033 [Burkholderia sp. 8Y]|nr:hypothetical protein BURKHO8Y_520033 [Burkholderia sp. 8Y]